ncbi:hypothetical protein FI667_g2566, partial [Globisporangium splendens]
MATVLIYTDGACKKNGTASARGCFGIFIMKSSILDPPTKINRKGERMEYKGETFYVTNIRMEGLAIVSTLSLYNEVLVNQSTTDVIKGLANAYSIDGFITHHTQNELKEALVINPITVEIVTDSEFWINVVEQWMPGWIRRNTLLQKKNPDILLMMRYYTERLQQNGITIKFTHVRSHQKGKRTAHADGNDVADVLATSAAKNSSSDFTIVS